MKAFVLLDFDIVGFHRWPNAPEEVCFLRNNHRHIFQIKCKLPVGDLDREKEIFIETKKQQEMLFSEFGNPCLFGSMSCEHIAEYLMENNPDMMSCEVLEDGKGGGMVLR